MMNTPEGRNGILFRQWQNVKDFMLSILYFDSKPKTKPCRFKLYSNVYTRFPVLWSSKGYYDSVA